MSDYILQVKDLIKTFKIGGGFLGGKEQTVRAVNGVSFDLRRGQSIGLVGESGCGKSTVARTILRLLEPDSGQVLFNGEDFAATDGAQLRTLRQKIQIVFQDPFASLNPRRTVQQTLAEPLQVHKLGSRQEINRRVKEILDEVGLPQSALDRYPHEFSGGQRQRIGIARALILDPELIIADEPVSALDVSVQAQVLQLLERLKKDRGLSFVFVSHDLGVVRYFCDEICVMYLGRIVEKGPTAQVLDAPMHPYSRILRDSSPVPDPAARIELKRIVGEVPAPTNLPNGCTYHPRCAHARDECKSQVPPTVLHEPQREVACFYPYTEKDESN